MANEKHITLTYLNIRQSIAILILRLALVDLLMAGIVIACYFLLVQGEKFAMNLASNTQLFLSVFILVGVLKIATGIYILLQWLNEYYEITPEYIIHKSGIIIKKQKRYRLDNVRVMEVVNSFFGELLNFGTIVLYDIRLNRYMDMYLIHNPSRYARVLKEIKPTLEMREDRVWLPGMGKELEPIEPSEE